MDNQKRKILIVDDDPGITKFVSKLLENQYRTSIAPDGRTAIEKTLSESPELVLLDLKLPDVNGREVLERIKQIDEKAAIIVMTAYGGEQIAVDLMKAGAIDYISKPFAERELIGAVRNAITIRDAQIEDKRSDKYFPLERFFPFLAHEIRNPLHAIDGALAIIQRRSDSSDKLLDQSIKIIKEEVQHLNEFVQECLDFVRPLDKNRLMEIEINEIISVVINIISRMYEGMSKRIEIKTDLDPNLPRMVANYEEIKQTFLNIVKNAFEAMNGEGELIINTRFKSSADLRYIEIIFVDHGVGIEEKNWKHLFEPFFTTKLRGTGLGLAICRRVIEERHNGKISIESEIGKGTAVRVELPVRRVVDLPRAEV
jgi:signal transduction histidine kinase